MFYFYFLLFLASVLFSLLLGKPIIKFLKGLSTVQTIREEGPARHREEKTCTPTIGALIFLIPILIFSMLVIYFSKEFRTQDFIVVFCTTIVLSFLGFLDDYLKVIKRHNKGVSGYMKLFIQLLISIVIFYLYKEERGILYFLLVYFVMAGASNSYNLTDGLDGLLANVSIASFIGFIVLLNLYGRFELLAFSVLFLGSLIGFLFFNKYPAKVFMGDTGSLAIGGAIGSLALVTRSELYLAFFASVPILEAISVILQVASCQFTKRFFGIDKRIFKMAPLHHHFEMCGWKENDVVRRFFMFQLACTLTGILLLVLRH